MRKAWLMHNHTDIKLSFFFYLVLYIALSIGSIYGCYLLFSGSPDKGIFILTIVLCIALYIRSSFKHYCPGDNDEDPT